MDKIPQFGDEIKEKEFTMTNGVTFVNHGSYGTVPRKVQEAQRRYRVLIFDLFVFCLIYLSVLSLNKRWRNPKG